MKNIEQLSKENLKTKSEKELLCLIRVLKKEIKKLKDELGNFNYDIYNLVTPEELTEILQLEQYLEDVKTAVNEVGGTYIPLKKELKAKEFRCNLNYLSSVCFMIAEGYAYRTYYLDFNSDNVILTSSKHREKDIVCILNRDDVIAELQNLNVDEWKYIYREEYEGQSLIDKGWLLAFNYANGKRPKQTCGFNAYPYNFPYLVELFKKWESQV